MRHPNHQCSRSSFFAARFQAAIKLAVLFATAALADVALADSLDSPTGRYYSRNSELSSYRFGFEAPPAPCPCLDPQYDPRVAYDAARDRNYASRGSASPRYAGRRYGAARPSFTQSMWDELKEYAIDFLPDSIAGDSAGYPDTPSVMPYGQARLPLRVSRYAPPSFSTGQSFSSALSGFSGYGGSSGSPERLTRRVQELSDSFVNSIAGLLKYYFGGEPAYADYGAGLSGGGFDFGGGSDAVDFDASERIAASLAEDGLVHF